MDITQKINQDARKQLILEDIINPKVSKIESKNKSYIRIKEDKRQKMEHLLSID